MSVTSTSVSDGYWLTSVTGTNAIPRGSNESPQLSFTAVENAACYVIYMIDTDSLNWMHWKAVVTKNELSLGESLENSEYVGPYPTSGTHTYTVYVFALESKAESYPGRVNAFGSGSISAIERSLGRDNIIGKGSVTAKVERNREVK